MGTPNWSMLKSTCGNHSPKSWTWWCEALFLFQLHYKDYYFKCQYIELLLDTTNHKTNTTQSSSLQAAHIKQNTRLPQPTVYNTTESWATAMLSTSLKKETITRTQHILLSQNFTLLQNLITQNCMSWEASRTVMNTVLLHPSCFSCASHYNGHSHQRNSPIDKLLILARTKSLQALHIVYSLKDLNYSTINVGVTLVLYVKMTYFVWQISWTMFYPFSNQAQSASNYEIYVTCYLQWRGSTNNFMHKIISK